MISHILHRLLVVATLLLLAVPVIAQPDTSTQGPSTPPPADTVDVASGTWVIFHGDTLFQIQGSVGSFSARDRATAITARLSAIAGDPLFDSDSLRVIEQESTSDIVAKDRVVMSVTNNDAKLSGRARPELALLYAHRMQTAISAEIHDSSIERILFGLLFTLLATVVLVIVIKLINRYHPKIISTMISWHGTKIKSLKFQNLEILPAERAVSLLVGIIRLLRAALVIFLLYIYLPLVFSFFPWTRNLAATLFGYILTPLDLVWTRVTGYLPNVFIILVIAVVSYYLMRFVRLLFLEVERGSVAFPGFRQDWATPTYKIVRFLMLVLTMIIIFPYLPGADSPAFQGIGLFLTLLLSLGAASAIANIVSGVVLTYTSAFALGDRVKIADTIGDVIEKTLLVTRVRTIKNVDITIPNSMVLGSHIINFSSSAKEHGLILHTSVTIGYDVPWKQVHELLISAAMESEFILDEPKPFVLQTSLDDWYVAYEVNAYTHLPNKMAVIYSDLHSRIQDKFNEAGVEIMSPHYQAVRDGNATAIPSDYLPPQYSAPGFKVFPFNTIFGGNKDSRNE